MENRLVEKIKNVLEEKINKVRNEIDERCVLETREAFKEQVEDSIKFLTKFHSKDCFRSYLKSWSYIDGKIVHTIECVSIMLNSEALKSINKKIGDQMNWYYLNAYQMKLKLFIDRVCDESEVK